MYSWLRHACRVEDIVNNRGVDDGPNSEGLTAMMGEVCCFWGSEGSDLDRSWRPESPQFAEQQASKLQLHSYLIGHGQNSNSLCLLSICSPTCRYQRSFEYETQNQIIRPRPELPQLLCPPPSCLCITDPPGDDTSTLLKIRPSSEP